MKLLLVTIGLVCCVASILGSSQLVFDLVSLKLDTRAAAPGAGPSVGCHGSDGTDPSFRVVPTGMCVANLATAQMMVDFAFDLPGGLNATLKDTIVGRPDWFDKDRYALQAKQETLPTVKDMRTMLQAMLADRFKLRSHLETKEVDGYVLLQEKDGVKLDPEDDLRSVQRPASSLQRASGNSTVPNTIGIKMRRGDAGPIVMSHSVNFRNMTMDYIARGLSTELEKPVINKTGLEGTYNLITKEFGVKDDADASAPSLSTLIHDVGLRLERQKVSITVLVIDHIEKPTFD